MQSRCIFMNFSVKTFQNISLQIEVVNSQMVQNHCIFTNFSLRFLIGIKVRQVNTTFSREKRMCIFGQKPVSYIMNLPCASFFHRYSLWNPLHKHLFPSLDGTILLLLAKSNFFRQMASSSFKSLSKIRLPLLFSPFSRIFLNTASALRYCTAKTKTNSVMMLLWKLSWHCDRFNPTGWQFSSFFRKFLPSFVFLRFSRQIETVFPI